jgi:hypothetical protein
LSSPDATHARIAKIVAETLSMNHDFESNEPIFARPIGWMRRPFLCFFPAEISIQIGLFNFELPLRGAFLSVRTKKEGRKALQPHFEPRT